jgi:hypothetical protein
MIAAFKEYAGWQRAAHEKAPRTRRAPIGRTAFYRGIIFVRGLNFVDDAEVIRLLNLVCYNPTKVYRETGVNSLVGEAVCGEFKKALLLYCGGSAKPSGGRAARADILEICRADF